MHVPQRMCRVCRTHRPKDELTRWVKEGSNLIEDTAKRLPGRGFYTCQGACSDKLGKPKVSS